MRRSDRARSQLGLVDFTAARNAARDDDTGPVDGPTHAGAFQVRPRLDVLPQERPLTIEINGHPIAKLLCTPNALQELGAGWVFGQGFAQRAEEVRAAHVRGERVSVMIDAPGPGGAAWKMLYAAGFDARQLCAPYLNQDGLAPLPGHGEPEAWHMPKEVFLPIVGEVFAVFREERGAGGFHYAAATDGHQMSPAFREISRHNAVDKVVGWSLLRRVARERHILCVSGRVSADIVLKAWRAGFPVVATRALPTAEAVGVAEVARIAIIGRVLDGRRTVYTHPWRLRLPVEEV